MARNRSVDLLPEIFKTDTNKEFLSSTLDQLTQEPKLKQTQGYIGKKLGTGIESGDLYVTEPTTERANYQLEPGVVFKDDNDDVESAITYPEMLDALKTKGANVAQHQRLFSAPMYSWSPLIDFDKFVNYSQYYWLPSGTNSVDVSATELLSTDNFDVTRNDASYSLSGVAGKNPTLTLARGGEYTFTTTQPGHEFYIQSEPGTSGVLSHSPNISSRDVNGVTNNGEDGGVTTFAVPSATSQQFYYDLTEINAIDLATTSRFDSVNGKLLSQILSSAHVDGIADLEGKTIVFLDTTAGNSADLGWQYLDLFESDSFESEPFGEATFIDSQADRYSVYQIEYLASGSETVIKLNKIKSVSNHEKFDILYGAKYSNKSFYKNSSGFFQEIPLLTSAHDTLYYQDATDENKFGIINLVDTTSSAVLDVDTDIVGKKTYTSPNGVEFTNGLKVIFRSNVTPSLYQNKEYYIEGVGVAIKLIAVSDLITPETYTTSETEPFDFNTYDSTNFDGNLNSPTVLDYITINRASNDLNPWSRSNRWVHRDVITKTAKYNNIVAVFDNNFRANRPIIEFHSNTKLFNFGTYSKTPVTLIDFNQDDAFSNINGSTGFSIDGFNVTNGARVIFATDTDTNVKNKIYDVAFVDLNNDGILSVELSEASDALVEVNQTVVCKNGTTLQGKSFYFNGTNWEEAQQKTAVNQAPLFDVYDANGISLASATVYPSSTFVGTKMFSYSVGTGANDKVLGFPLTYLNVDNLGDIVFNNDLYVDKFSYGTPTVSNLVSNGYIRKYTNRTTYKSEIGWTNFVHDSTSEQVFNFDYNGVSLILDVLPKTGLSIPAIKVYNDNKFINASEYTITTTATSTVIEFINTVTDNSEIQVTIISDSSSDVAYYNIPKNLENNPFNENSSTLTLGTIRHHYTHLAQNLLELSGEVHGINNSRDLGNIEQYGNIIIQHSSPIAPMAKFLDSKEFNFFDAVEFNANAYEKFKLKLANYVIENNTYGITASAVVDNALDSINVGKTISSAFYNSDMIGGNGAPTVTTHTVTPISTDTFNIVNIYDFTKANRGCVYVYVNNKILVKDVNYTVATSAPTITILDTLSTGDVITINEFATTVGNHVPNTPTKLGLHPAYQPKKYLDDSYSTPINVIQGHDGSITVAYNDVRDDVLLEFESRIFNNIKISSKIPILDVDVIPGKFRSTEYTDAETTSILATSFLNWVGWNRLDYKTQDFLADNELTWNYSTCSSKLDNTALKGHWRGVYKDYYDTDTPHITPWEMLGITAKPTWWETEYGVAPYTNGNLVLWGDLEAGLIKEPGNNVVDTRYKRTGLTKVIPVDSEGKLLNPFISIVQNYSKPDLKKSWVVGDCSPVENAWRRSSSYRFALQRLYALTKPAQYFALSIDRDLYAYDSSIKQYLLNARYRLDVRNTIVQTLLQPKHSYINWVADYHINNGCSCVQVKDELAKVDIRLCYRMASFTDKNYLKIFTDKSSPDSSNTGLLLPDQSYNLLLHKNQPLTELQYSSVIVQKTDDGYAVHGHSKSQQYFEIYQSVQDSNSVVLGDYVIPSTFTKTVTLVPYGYVFTNKGSVIDFLVSYGAFLESRGLVFSTTENTIELNWGQMAQEFISWASQDWGVGSIVNLNPSAISLEFNKELLIVDNINADAIDALDQNGLPLTPSDYVVTRLDNSFKVTTINNKTINFLKIKSVSYEHLLVLDNTSVFNDLIYQPVTGLRQQRVRLVGFTTFDWNGQLDAQGFILNQDNVKDWKANTFYTMGHIVKFKNTYWSAIARLAPSAEFNFGDWSKINYNDISTGLLPNISNKAGQIKEYYNKKTTNLEADVDLLAMGLTGFRPRSHFSSLDDVSQVNFYTDFVANKGTTQSANVFRNIKFDKKVTDYEIFENWAIREATYGNSDNKVFAEFALDSTKLQNNPSVVEVVENSSVKVSPHQLIKLDEIYNQSTTHTSKSIFPVRTSKLTDTSLPTAGHVNTNDVDIALYEISDLNGASGIPFMSKISSGTTLWVAKDTPYDWNVYRANTHSNINSIIPNDNVLEITFYHNHDFVVNDTLVIQGISTLIDGAHNVASIVSSKVIRIQGTLANAFVNIASDSSITSDTVLYTADHMLGNAYKLTSVRLPSSDNLSDAYIDLLPIGANVWVDDNSSNKYATYKKYDVVGNITSDSKLVTSDSDVYSADGNGAWGLLREEQDVVDVTLINRAILFDKDTQQTTNTLDYIDPLNGKILGLASENINYTGGTDPASYTQGTSITGVVWDETHVGEMWWDTSNVRFLDYNQADLNYASKNWGALFPGSTVDIRQWVKSSEHPSQYSGQGSVVDVTSYTTVSSIDTTNSIVQHYYYWVTDIDNVTTNKTLSVNAVKQYISTPASSGVAFIAFLNNSTIGIYNSQKYIDNSVLHVSYNNLHIENEVFNEYSLIKENNKHDFLSATLYKKLQDSFVGGNTIGLAVPDKKLNIAQRAGVNYRPRQSMFENRFNALEAYLTQVNAILKPHIISTNRNFDLLNEAEAVPGKTTNKWDLQVADLSELYYQNLSIVAVGYKYLVTTDTSNNGGWSIYEVVTGKILQLVQVQTYDTTRAWTYIDWYESTDAEQAVSTREVSDSSKLTSLDVADNTYVKVTSNSNGKFELYQLRMGYWVRVGLEDGTICFNSTLWSGGSTQDNITIDTDSFTVDSTINTADVGTGGTELRNVIKSINDYLLVDDLLIERNKLLISMFNYILAEQGTANWLSKTSLIDVEHTVRDLEQYSTYKKDNQDFLLKYLNESKPYHTKIKEFLLKYNGSDQYNTDIADFDVPVYYDNSFSKYISPVLDYEGASLKSDQSNFDDNGVGLTNPNYNIWKLSPWDSWYNNRALSIKSATIVNAGSSYTQIPTVTVTGGGATTQATMSARINNSGQLISVSVDTNGTGYTSTPTITISGFGTGAIVTPVMQNELVRNLNTTIKYDRCEYTATVVDWVSNTTLSTTVDIDTLSADNNTSALTVDSYDTVYDADQLVRYNNKVYTHNVTRAFKTKFLLSDFTEVSSDTLTSADRTLGYYTPGTNDIGLSLPMLIHGIDYPGVIVKDLDFNNSAGFSVLPFDTEAFDNISVADDGSASYSAGVLDAEYSSSFNNLYLGTQPEDINADGGGFVDTYSSHSPEELIPGSMFDTLDLSVHTRPGFDYQGNGHAFEIQYVLHEYQHSSPTLSFDNVVAHPITIKVVNTSTRTTIHLNEDYTVNWVNKTITVTNAAFDGDNIQIFVYEIGGGNQLFRNTYVGSEVLNSLTIPVESQSIYDIVILVNGTQLKDGFTSSSDGSITVDSILETADSSTITVDKVSLVNSTNTTISFTDTYSGTDFISVTVFGFETTQHNYTYPIVTHFSPYGADTTEYTADTALLTADNVSSDYDLSVVYTDDKNKQNAIVEHNGKRLRPPEAKRYAGDDAVTDFRLPTVGGVDHTLVSNSEIVVFNGFIKQTLSTDYTVITVVVGAVTYKEVRFTTAPATNAVVDVYVNTISDYTIDSSSVLRVKPHITIAGIDELDVTTWNDTEEIDLLTSSFKGPTTVTTPVIDLFDASDFDSVGFDFVGTSSADINLFDLGRTIVVGYRLWVTINGDVLLDGVDYSVSGTQLLLAGELIGPTDIVTVTSMTGSIVPDALAFKIFKDMNGNSAMYKINTCCLKKVNLVSDLNITDDTIYLNDVSNLTVPNLTLGTFGIVTIDGERITYRNVDNGANTISGLRRGTAGTGITKHTKETVVHDVSITNIVTNSVITSTTLGADTDTASTAHDNIWYASGASTVSNGIALQNQTTAQANFVKTR